MEAGRCRVPPAPRVEEAHRGARSEVGRARVAISRRCRAMMGRIFCVALVTSAMAVSANAQDDVAPPSGPLQFRFIPRYDFHISADRLSTQDPRFVWDTNFGGDVDVVDYGVGRATFTANFESILGNQFRNFDPNQGNYLLDGSLSWRTRGTEVAALFHHTSPHLTDRFKRSAVAWNMLGARVQRDVPARKADIDIEGDLLGSLVKNNVDYKWQATGAVHVAVPLRASMSMITSARLQFLGVDATEARPTQTGSRAEAG